MRHWPGESLRGGFEEPFQDEQVEVFISPICWTTAFISQRRRGSPVVTRHEITIRRTLRRSVRIRAAPCIAEADKTSTALLRNGERIPLIALSQPAKQKPNGCPHQRLDLQGGDAKLP